MGFQTERPAPDTKLSIEALSSIPHSFSNVWDDWGTHRPKNELNAVSSRLKASDLSTKHSDLADSTKDNYAESDSRRGRRKEYVESKHSTIIGLVPAKVKPCTI